MTMFRAFFPLGLIPAVLAACSPAVDTAGNASATGNAQGPSADRQAAAVPAPVTAPASNADAAATGIDAKVIGLAGLGDLRIGQPVPKGSRFAARGGQEGDACRTISSPDYPGVQAIVTGGKVRRIAVGGRSDVRLVEGIGIGASEAEVSRWFAGFRAEPHKYEAAPAKYLTAPNATSGDPAVRFEIGRDRKVRLIHVGTMPELGYVEGCA